MRGREFHYPLTMVEYRLRVAAKKRESEVELERAERAEATSQEGGSSTGVGEGEAGDGAYYEVCYLGYGAFMGVVRESV